MYSELSLLGELYNPLYLFPIFCVVFTALMVYAFGFKSSTQPPTEVFDALNDKHHKNYKTHNESIKRKKPNIQKITSKQESKSEPNGHITSGSLKSTEKKAPKKAVSEPKATSDTPKTKTSAKKVQKKKNQDLDERQDIDDSGEWVELISKKEKKNRKQKEEQLLIDSKSSKDDKSSDKSPKRGAKKVKNQKNIDLNSKPKDEKVVERAKNELNSTKLQNDIQSEELVSEEPDIYELAKEQRVPKKSQKRNQKRNSESEVTAKAEPTPESDSKTNLNLSDKLTAAIVANYEANDNNKNDSLNALNNKKKKEKNKKKVNPINTETNDKQIIKNEEKIASNVSNDTSIEKSIDRQNSVDIPNEVKVAEEEEFKSVGKKRRARRE